MKITSKETARRYLFLSRFSLLLVVVVIKEEIDYFWCCLTYSTAAAANDTEREREKRTKMGRITAVDINAIRFFFLLSSEDICKRMSNA